MTRQSNTLDLSPISHLLPLSSRPPCRCGDNLRPIGSEFETVSLPDYSQVGGSTDMRGRLNRWRVVAHGNVICPTHYAPTRSETIILVAVKRKAREGIPVVRGRPMLDWQLSVDLGYEAVPDFSDVEWET